MVHSIMALQGGHYQVMHKELEIVVQEDTT